MNSWYQNRAHSAIIQDPIEHCNTYQDQNFISAHYQSRDRAQQLNSEYSNAIYKSSYFYSAHSSNLSLSQQQNERTGYHGGFFQDSNNIQRSKAFSTQNSRTVQPNYYTQNSLNYYDSQNPTYLKKRQFYENEFVPSTTDYGESIHESSKYYGSTDTKIEPTSFDERSITSVTQIASNESVNFTNAMQASKIIDTLFKKRKVICVSPDEEMSYLLDLPPSCNVLIEPSLIGLSGKAPETSFHLSFLRFIRGEQQNHLLKPRIEKCTSDESFLPGKKPYVPPYTPKSTNSDNSTPASDITIKNRTSPKKRGVKISLNLFKNKRKTENKNREEELPKRILSRRKAKESPKKEIFYEDDDDDGFNPSDSDDDATWTPLQEKSSEMSAKRERFSFVDEEEEKEVFPLKKIKSGGQNFSNPFQIDDFVVLKINSDVSQCPIYKVVSKKLLQRYAHETDVSAKSIHRSTSVFIGINNNSISKYQIIKVKYLQKSESSSVVQIATQDTEKINCDILQKSRAETAQYQESFEVYIQSLISQSLDQNFLNEVIAEKDDYFISNIDKVDSVTRSRIEKVMSGVCWSTSFQHSISTWPCISDLGAGAVQDARCRACDGNNASNMIQMFGQPYDYKTLKPSLPDEDVIVNRNFSVCKSCSRLATMYNGLYHQKFSLYLSCSELVDQQKKSFPDKNTTLILNELLTNETWLDILFKKIQDLWASADAYIR